MDEPEWLAQRLEAHRTHLRAVAYRMLGSLSEVDDAVQKAWLHLTRSGTGGVENLGGWLTTVVARVSLDMLRSRRSLSWLTAWNPLVESRRTFGQVAECSQSNEVCHQCW